MNAQRDTKYLRRVICGWCSGNGWILLTGNPYREAAQRCTRCAGLGYVVVEIEEAA